MKYLVIPDLENIEEYEAFSKEQNVSFEYNEFAGPNVYTDANKVIEYKNIIKGLNRKEYTDTMHGAFLGLDISAADPVLRKRSRELIEESICIASELKLKGVVFHTGLIGTLRIKSYMDNWLNEAAAFFRKMCLEHRDTIIYIENTFEQEPDAIVALMVRLKDVENIKICFDYGHAILTQTPIEKWCEAFLPYIGHMHLNDNDLKDDLHLVPGDGCIDFCKWKDLVQKNSLDGNCLIELTGMDNIKRSLEYIRKLQG